MTNPNLPYTEETIIGLRRWNDQYFSVETTRPSTLRFDNGEFLMIGLEVDGKPLLRAYSVASANWEEKLNFLSIHVPDGALTSRLAKAHLGDKILIGKKSTGTLLISDLCPGRALYLIGTGTGLAPWLSIAKDPETYSRFEHVAVIHGVRRLEDLAHRDLFETELPNHEFLGELCRTQLHYLPTTTREVSQWTGRTTDLFMEGKLSEGCGLPPPDKAKDRIMLCGGPEMLASWRTLLDSEGWQASPRIGVAGSYVFERAFVDK